MDSKKDKKRDLNLDMPPINKRELNKKLKILETDEEKIAYISKLNKFAESLIRDHKYGGAMGIYETLGALEKAKDAAEKGERYFSNHDTRNPPQPGGAPYCQHKVEYYNKLILEKITTGRKFPKLPLLEKIVGIIGIGGAFLCSLIFLSSNITGNTILNSSFKLSNIIGAGLFIIGVVASFLYVNKR